MLFAMAYSDDDAASEASASDDYADIDPEDPMRDYLIAQRKEQKAHKKEKSKGKSKHKDETPEERRARKERKKAKKAKKSQGIRGVEDLLNELESLHRRRGSRDRDPSPVRRRSVSLERRHRRDGEERRSRPYSPERRERSRSPISSRDERSYKSRNTTERTRRPEDRTNGQPYSRDSERTPPPVRRGPRD